MEIVVVANSLLWLNERVKTLIVSEVMAPSKRPLGHLANTLALTLVVSIL